MPAGRKELSPLVEGCNTWCEEDVEFFEEAEATGFAGDVVASQLLFQEVPGDGEVGALPSELVDVPCLLRVVPGLSWFSSFMSSVCP